MLRRRKRNQIRGIFYGGKWVSNLFLVKQTLYDHYRSFFSATGRDPILTRENLTVPNMSPVPSRTLVNPFTIQEIEFALHESRSTKAQVLGRFNFGFIKANWEILCVDVLKLFNEFFLHNRLPNGCNSSFLALIPKTHNPIYCGDYRPISLINCLIKLLTKVFGK